MFGFSKLSAIPEFIVLLLALFVAGTLTRFVWRVFLYKYWRANRIRRIRERRELREAAQR